LPALYNFVFSALLPNGAAEEIKAVAVADVVLRIVKLSDLGFS